MNISLKYKIAKVVITMAATVPLLCFAATASAATTSNSADTISAFCASVDSSATNIDTLISKKEADYSAGKSALKDALATSRAATDKELYDERVAANADYAAQFKSLAQSATTPQQQAAVVTFKKTVLQAIATRRANVDVAIKNYRDAVDAILASHDAAYENALTTLKIDAASDCSKAQSTFHDNIADIDDASTQLSTLAATRDAKVAAAGTKFSATVDTAAAALKTILGQ